MLFAQARRRFLWASLVIWPSLYEGQRRIILAAGMIAVQGAPSTGRARLSISSPTS
jgi:hypothetical protein